VGHSRKQSLTARNSLILNWWAWQSPNRTTSTCRKQSKRAMSCQEKSSAIVTTITLVTSQHHFDRQAPTDQGRLQRWRATDLVLDDGDVPELHDLYGLEVLHRLRLWARLGRRCTATSESVVLSSYPQQSLSV
jgi:hypothetical protein